MRTEPPLFYSYGALSEVDRHYCEYLAVTWETKENKESRDGQKPLLKLVLNELKLISKERLTDLQPPSLKQTRAFKIQNSTHQQLRKRSETNHYHKSL